MKKFFIKDFFGKCDQIRTEEILNGKLQFLCNQQNNSIANNSNS